MTMSTLGQTYNIPFKTWHGLLMLIGDVLLYFIVFFLCDTVNSHYLIFCIDFNHNSFSALTKNSQAPTGPASSVDHEESTQEPNQSFHFKNHCLILLLILRNCLNRLKNTTKAPLLTTSQLILKVK